MRFLVLDDVTTNCSVLKQLASKAFDAETVTTTSPLDALTRCRNERFDAVIVDYFMPAMNGIDFTRLIRRIEGYRDVPIAVVTMSDARRVRDAAIDAGANLFLTKPVGPEEFRTRLGACLSARASA